MQKKIVNKNGYTTYKDEEDNLIYIREVDNVVQISLKLKGDKFERKIAKVIRAHRIIKFVRKREKHLIRRRGGYALNRWVLENGQAFDHVIIEDNYDTWKIPLKDVLERGERFQVKVGGFEAQLLLTLEKLTEYELQK